VKPLAKSILLLVAVEIIILSAGFLVTKNFKTGFEFTEVALLSPLFVIITLTSLIIFFRGQSKSPESQTMHSLISVSLKFLLELILVFVWFFIAKKSGISSVLLFFVLYLTFTLFLIFVLLKTLKNKLL
jgi:hypothetical protein